MPKPRFSGGSVSMRVSSSQMLPPDSGSRPAMQLSAVDLPQPDGPSSAMNSPRANGDRQLVQRVERVPARAGEAARDPVEPQFAEIVLHRWKCPAVRASAGQASFRLLRADLLVPDPERLDLRLGRQRLRVREFLQPRFVLRPAVFLDRVLASFGAIDSDTFFTAGPG